jgi:hypothetical protein
MAALATAARPKARGQLRVSRQRCMRQMIGRWLRRQAIMVLSQAAAMLFGCNQAPSPQQPAPSRLVDGLVTLVPYATPARWLSYPRRLSPGVGRVTLGSQQVFLDGVGQRWLADSDGRLTASPTVAPELLLGAGVTTRGFWFVGESGTTYTSPTILGELTLFQRPPVPFARIASSPSSVVGITNRGQLFASHDHGATWLKAAPHELVADVALMPDGHGLALLTPERFMMTSDFGRHWEPSDIGPLGTTHLLAGEREVGLLALLGRFAWSPGKPISLAGPAASTAVDEPLVSEIHASASAIASGVAALQGRNYQEVESRDASLVLWSGDVERPLQQVATSVAKCRSPKVFVGEDSMFLLCFSGSERFARFRLLRTEDGGKTFEEYPRPLYGAIQQVRAAVWRDALVLSGICAPDGEPDGCVANGVFLLPKRFQKGAAVKRLALPLLAGAALGISVAPGTNRLFIVGAHRKGGSAALFSAAEPAASFEVMALPEVAVGLRRGQSLLDVKLGAWSQEGYGSFTFQSAASQQRQLIVVDEEGHLVQSSNAPSSGASISSVGLRVLAVDARSNQVWESMVGGASWTEIEAPPIASCRADDTTCGVDLSCYDGGCLVGERWLRVGWGGRQVRAPDLAQGAEQPQTLGTAIVCKVADDASWKSVAGGELPDASRASLNGVDWFAHSVDWTTAGVNAYEMPLSADGSAQTLRTAVLFDPRPDPNQWVVYAAKQTEGVAGLRAREGSAVIEVVWRNLFSGPTTHRVKLGDAGVLMSSPTRFSTRAGQPGLVSIAQGGIFVRTQEKPTTTYFMKESGQVQLLPPMVWPALMEAGRTDMTSVDGSPLGLKLFRGGTVLGRARLVEGVWQFDAMSVGLDERAFDVQQSFEITYGPSGPLYYFWQQFADSIRGTVFPMQANGTVLGSGARAVTQEAINSSSEPPLCTPQALTASPRIIAPPQKGVRYPIMVEHRSEPLRSFVSNFAVLHGPVEKACIAVFDADALSKVPGEEQSVLVRPEPGQASWLFRRISGASAFEYRAMECGYDASTSLPSEVVARARAKL